MFDKHADIKNEILRVLSSKPLRVSVFYEEWTTRPTGKNVIGVEMRRKIKGKATLAKDYYVRLKN